MTCRIQRGVSFDMQIIPSKHHTIYTLFYTITAVAYTSQHCFTYMVCIHTVWRSLLANHYKSEHPFIKRSSHSKQALGLVAFA